MSVVRAKVPSGTLISLPCLLDTCLVAAVAAQQYVHENILSKQQSDSISKDLIKEKGKLEHKKGEMDVTTQADLAVQKIVLSVLNDAQSLRKVAMPYRLSYLSDEQLREPPFLTIVGEESDEEARPESVQIFKEYLEKATNGPICAAARKIVLNSEVWASVEALQQITDSEAKSSERKIKMDGVSMKKGWWMNRSLDSETDDDEDDVFGGFTVHHHPGHEAKRKMQDYKTPGVLYTVYVDPIDATLAFVNGDKQAPMTLIGIARNGVPVAGIAMRVFNTAVASSANSDSYFPEASSLSICITGGPSLLWGHIVNPCPQHIPIVHSNAVKEAVAKRKKAGKNVPPREKATLVSTFSDSTYTPAHKILLRSLLPMEPIPLRGGGNKVLYVCAKAATAFNPTIAHLPNADIFPSTGGLKHWDFCGPHAFLRSYGGAALVFRGFPAPHQYEEDGEMPPLMHVRELRYTLPREARKRLAGDMSGQGPTEDSFCALPYKSKDGYFCSVVSCADQTIAQEIIDRVAEAQMQNQQMSSKL